MRVNNAKRKELEEAERKQIATLRAYLDSLAKTRTDEWQDRLSQIVSWPEFSLEDAS